MISIFISYILAYSFHTFGDTLGEPFSIAMSLAIQKGAKTTVSCSLKY